MSEIATAISDAICQMVIILQANPLGAGTLLGLGTLTVLALWLRSREGR